MAYHALKRVKENKVMLKLYSIVYADGQKILKKQE